MGAVWESLNRKYFVRVTMATEHTETITAAARFYRLHREEQLALKKEAYSKRPDVLAKREERERKRVERDIANAAKKEEREKKRQERIMIAEQTKRKFKGKPEETLLRTEMITPALREF
jgi:hypothetical protein